MLTNLRMIKEFNSYQMDSWSISTGSATISSSLFAGLANPKSSKSTMFRNIPRAHVFGQSIPMISVLLAHEVLPQAPYMRTEMSTCSENYERSVTGGAQCDVCESTLRNRNDLSPRTYPKSLLNETTHNFLVHASASVFFRFSLR